MDSKYKTSEIEYTIFNTNSISIIIMEEREKYIFEDSRYKRYGNIINICGKTVVGKEYEDYSCNRQHNADIHNKIFIVFLNKDGIPVDSRGYDHNVKSCCNSERILSVVKEVFLTEPLIQTRVSKGFDIGLMTQFVRFMTRLHDGHKFICLSRLMKKEKIYYEEFRWFLGSQKRYKQPLIKLSIKELNELSDSEFNACEQSIIYAKKLIDNNKNINISQIIDMSFQLSKKYGLNNIEYYSKNKKSVNLRNVKDINKIIEFHIKSIEYEENNILSKEYLNKVDEFKIYMKSISNYTKDFYFLGELTKQYKDNIKSLLRKDYLEIIKNIANTGLQGSIQDVGRGYINFHNELFKRIDSLESKKISYKIKNLFFNKKYNQSEQDYMNKKLLILPKSFKYYSNIIKSNKDKNPYILKMNYPATTDHDLPHDEKMELIRDYIKDYKDINIPWTNRDIALKRAKLLTEFEIFSQNKDINELQSISLKVMPKIDMDELIKPNVEQENVEPNKIYKPLNNLSF